MIQNTSMEEIIRKNWCLITFMAGDNSLSEDGVKDIKEMKQLAQVIIVIVLLNLILKVHNPILHSMEQYDMRLQKKIPVTVLAIEKS